MGEIIKSPRFVTANDLVRDLCIRTKDFKQTNRLYYKSLLGPAYLKLNLKTEFFVKRVAIVVEYDNGLPYIPTPDDYLEMASMGVEGKDGRLRPAAVNAKVRVDVADLSLAERCGCKCGCKHDYCSAVRNFETVYGTMAMGMPDGSTQTFTTTYRKYIMRDGSYVEEQTLPAKIYQNNIHTATQLETTQHILCKLDIEPECGCIRKTEHNRKLIEHHCVASSVAYEAGSSHIDKDCDVEPMYNVDDIGTRIYLPSNFNYNFVVLRYFHNSKTKDILIPFIAVEAVMSGIMEVASAYDKGSPQYEKGFWEHRNWKDVNEMTDNLYAVKVDSFLAAVIGKGIK